MITLISFVAGLVLMFAWWIRNPAFFRRRLETLPEDPAAPPDPPTPDPTPVPVAPMG